MVEGEKWRWPRMEERSDSEGWMLMSWSVTAGNQDVLYSTHGANDITEE